VAFFRRVCHKKWHLQQHVIEEAMLETACPKFLMKKKKMISIKQPMVASQK